MTLILDTGSASYEFVQYLGLPMIESSALATCAFGVGSGVTTDKGP